MSRIESFTRMFDPDAAQGDVITRVEIPLIQRDYAQGRRGEKVETIRRNFLSVLREAIATDDAEPVGLDFVYGERKENGTLQPLDGQQRLTTLFLLHWYLAARSENLDAEAGWKRFSYETRASARRFCERLVSVTPPPNVARLSTWVQEQPWYLFVWRYDPTINAMLVMIDAIDDQFANVDVDIAWKRLTDTDSPAVSFHLLPLPDMGSAEDLYVKMNSRGKPLTEFENFKARFEKLIEWSPRATDFAKKADTDWSDVLWAFRGDDNAVDDEFLRYFEFVTEVCEWLDDELDSETGSSLTARAANVFGAENPRASEHLDFLFTAFDVWVGRDTASTFEEIFGPSALPLFFRDANSNLLESCCRSYGDVTGSNSRTFTFGQSLLLLAVVLHLAHGTTDFEVRIRILRNLIEASQSEMRTERMPRLVTETFALIIEGKLPEPRNTFAGAQIGDEEDKQAFLAGLEEGAREDSAAILRSLEDTTILKGTTSAFKLDDLASLTSRATTFHALMADTSLWPDLTRALLTFGEYQWPSMRFGTLTDSESFQFGTGDGHFEDAWRKVFVGRNRRDVANTADVLAACLDALAESDSPLDVALRDLSQTWLEEQEAAETFDWRYYLVKYPAMRQGESGLYFAEGRRMGFSLTNLPGGKRYRNAYFYDPYLSAVHAAAGSPLGVGSLWFTGYEWDPRWLRLIASGIGLRSVPEGFQIDPPSGGFDEESATKVAALGVGLTDEDSPRYLWRVAKNSNDENGPDATDRILAGATLLKGLLGSGF